MKLRKPIASLASVALLSIGMVTMAASTASAHTNDWSSHWNGWSWSSDRSNGGGNDHSKAPVSTHDSAPAATEKTPAATEKSPAVTEKPKSDPQPSKGDTGSSGGGVGAADSVTETFTWSLPDGGTSAHVTWPQTLVGAGSGYTPPCGVTYQVDEYTGSKVAIDAIIADGKLTNVGGVPEDHAVVTHWSYKTGDRCKPEQPQQKVVTTDWVNGTWGCDATTVQQTRTVTTTSYVWDAGSWSWVLDAKSATVKTETQTRNLSPSEETVCPPGTLPIPASPAIAPPTCSADGSATLVNGDHYTWSQTSFGPGSWTATATPASGYTFDKSGATYKVTFTVAPKLTGAVCTVADVLSAPPNSSVTPAPFSEVLAAAPNASTASVLAATGATPLPLAIIALVLLGAGALLQPRVRRAIFTRH